MVITVLFVGEWGEWAKNVLHGCVIIGCVPEYNTVFQLGGLGLEKRDNTGVGNGEMTKKESTPAIRLAWLTRELFQQRRMTYEQMMNAFGCCRRTVERYVGDLEAAYIPLQRVKTESGALAIQLDRNEAKGIGLDDWEAVGLTVALMTLEAFEDDILHEGLAELRQKLLAQLNRKGERNEENISREWHRKFMARHFLPPSYRTIPVDGQSREARVFSLVVRALHDEQRLRFTYRDAAGKTSSLVVDPLTLVLYKGAFYLFARPDGETGTSHRRYHLSRISDPEILVDGYVYPKEWNPEIAINPFTGMMPGEEESFLIRFDSSLESVVRSHCWPEGTEIRVETDGVYLRTSLVFNDELRAWLLGFGPRILVLEPESVRSKLRDFLNKTREAYGEPTAGK